MLRGLILQARKAFLTPEHGKHIKHRRRGRAPRQRGTQGLREVPKLGTGILGGCPHDGLRRSWRPLRQGLETRQEHGDGRARFFAQYSPGLVIERQRPTDEEEISAVQQFDQRLCTLLQSGHCRKKPGSHRAIEPGSQRRQTASVEYDKPLARGNWATSVVWGRVHKIATGTNLNGYLLESTLNFLRRDYAFARLELVDKDELFPQAAVHPAYRIGAYTFGGVRDLVQNRAYQLGLGADMTVYSKPAALDAAYGNRPVSFQIFLRVRPGLRPGEHHH